MVIRTRAARATALFASAVLAASAHGEPAVALQDGDRIVFVGNTFLERENEHGTIETMLVRLHPGKKITFRNLAWSGDTVDVQMRPLNFGSLETHVAEQKPTLIIASFGMGESFEGEAGLPAFEKGLDEMLDKLAKIQPRMVLIGPIRHENLGPPFADPVEHNKSLKRYVDAMRRAAAVRSLSFVDLVEGLDTADRGRETAPTRLTDNGIHLSAYGYARAAEAIARALDPAFKSPLPDLAAGRPNALREAILEKNRLWFYRWRAHNGEYIYGRRAKAFEGNAGNDQFVPEMAALDKLLREADEKIWKLSAPVPHTYELAPEK